MSCQMKYKWVKLPREQIPLGKGIMGAWMRLASRVAFRDGQAKYCTYINEVSCGSWVGGMVGFKSILGVNRRAQALKAASKLSEMDYISFELDPRTKKLTYSIKDWVVSCSGAPCSGSEAVYATPGYGFLCLPRNITQRLVETHYQFDEADAWLDLWCHTVWQEPDNAFSHMAPAVQFGRHGAILSLESLGRRWGWEKTKVWRFFKKYADAFPLYKLPGAFGCLIFNAGYPAGIPFSPPERFQIERILREIRIQGDKTHTRKGCGRQQLCIWIAWYSRRLAAPEASPAAPWKSGGRVALSGSYITRAYFSHVRHYKSFVVDCRTVKGYSPPKNEHLPREGPEKSSSLAFSGGIEYGRFEGDPLW